MVVSESKEIKIKYIIIDMRISDFSFYENKIYCKPSIHLTTPIQLTNSFHATALFLFCLGFLVQKIILSANKRTGVAYQLLP